jgi:lactoylglutathione lyase
VIAGVRSVGIYVGDQDRAKAFWTEQMGFELLQDSPFGEGERWIEVQPPDKGAILVLYTPPEAKDMVGTFSNVLFHSDDINKTYEELTERRVEFVEKPSQQFWGWWAVFKDPDGNTYGLGQSSD